MGLPMGLPVLDVPTYELVLPSTNKKVKYRPFLVKEHKILMTLKDSSPEEVSRVVRELVDVCTYNKLKVKQLPHFDIEYLFVNLRSKSIGENLDLIVTCSCGNEIPTTVNLNDVQVIKNNNHTNKIRMGNLVVEMQYPSFDDMVKLNEYQDVDLLFKIIANNLKTITKDDEVYNVDEYTDQEKEEFLLSLTKDQFTKLEQFYTTMPKVVQQVAADCDKCGKHNDLKLEGLQNFFV